MTSDLIEFQFRLYIAGDAPNSLRAMANLEALCREYLSGRYDIEVVDVISQPERALTDGILMTPTLFKFAPEPTRKIIGNLSQTTPVLEALGLGAPSS
jgi:circadian clock protein KaiB